MHGAASPLGHSLHVGVSKRKGWEPARIMIREVRIESVVRLTRRAKVVFLDHPQFDFWGSGSFHFCENFLMQWIEETGHILAPHL